MRHIRPRDGGQMMISLVVVVCLTVLGFFVIALVPIGAATDERTRSQTAADAAALAGAERVRTEWVDVHTAPGPTLRYGSDPGLAVLGGSGAADAEAFAHRNGSAVTLYQFDPGTGQARVAVRNTYTAYPESGVARSEATAEIDLDAGACEWSPPAPAPEPSPSPEPSPPPAPSPAPSPGEEAPPAYVTATLTCGPWSATYRVLNSAPAGYPTESYAAGDTRDQLYLSLEPRLVE